MSWTRRQALATLYRLGRVLESAAVRAAGLHILAHEPSDQAMTMALATGA